METDRTIFSLLKLSDYDEVFRLYSNESVRKYLGGVVDLARFDEKFKSFLSVQLPECYWIIRQKDSNNFIGMLSITRHHNQEHFEISYELHPDFWGKGYGTEVVRKGIEHAFDNLGLSELYAETQKKNIQSIKLLKKSGMELDSEVERFGELQVIYSIKNKRHQ
ncbi:MAG: hypothetical protein ACD_15C00108G0001 [uncultured bacterium]|nr:MAG: hypothetical protein ACD_15C00108G0001 [uncultured bacterium]